MAKISIIYHSGGGHTAALAEAVAQGVRAVPNTQTEVIAIQGSDIKEGRWSNEAVLAKLSASDAIIFGSPTYMGGPSGQFKAFADGTAGVWFSQGWLNKIAAGFTVSGSPSGDKLSTLYYFFTLAQQHGMLWVGNSELPYNDKGINRLGSFSGVMAQAGQEPPTEAPNAEDKLTGELFGKRVAEATARWLRGASAH